MGFNSQGAVPPISLAFRSSIFPLSPLWVVNWIVQYIANILLLCPHGLPLLRQSHSTRPPAHTAPALQGKRVSRRSCLIPHLHNSAPVIQYHAPPAHTASALQGKACGSVQLPHSPTLTTGMALRPRATVACPHGLSFSGQLTSTQSLSNAIPNPPFFIILFCIRRMKQLLGIPA